MAKNYVSWQLVMPILSATDCPRNSIDSIDENQLYFLSQTKFRNTHHFSVEIEFLHPLNQLLKYV